MPAFIGERKHFDEPASGSAMFETINRPLPRKVRDLAGIRYGRLRAITFSHRARGTTYWWFLCDCGNYKLTSNHKIGVATRSCGCLSREVASETLRRVLLKHGRSETRLNGIFSGMLKRCYNPNTKSYKDYGGRGITVCDEWRGDRMAFFRWADLNGYDDHLAIDRINNDEGYSPENCRWVSYKTNNNNKRNHVYLTFRGETLNVSAWEEKLGVKAGRLRSRILNGWPVELAITAPFIRGGKEYAKTKPKPENRGRVGYGLAKLDEFQVRKIKERLANGESRSSIAKDFGVGSSAIVKIAKGQRWAWV